eukprot:gene31802-41273_t
MYNGFLLLLLTLSFSIFKGLSLRCGTSCRRSFLGQAHSSSSSSLAASLESTPAELSSSLYYTFKSSRFGTEHNTRYVYSSPVDSTNAVGNVEPLTVIFLHGFGGNADQFRLNLPVLSKSLSADCYALDLLGYGYSDKPDPRDPRWGGVNQLYNFETWADQVHSFIRDVAQKKGGDQKVVLVCNSVGGVVGLQCAVSHPAMIQGVVLIDISLRLLHVKKQNPLMRPMVSALQTVLRQTPVGEVFFQQVAQRDALRNILNQAYARNPDLGVRGVDDETVELLLRPGLDPRAVHVFLDFISYSGGPLPEELLPVVSCPVRVLWGEFDPWEPLEMGQELFSKDNFPCIDEFVVLKK